VLVLERGKLHLAVIDGDDLRNPRIEDSIEHLIETSGHRGLVVDLSRVESTASYGAELLIAVHGLAMIYRTRMAFVGVRPRVQRLLASYGADQILAVYETVGEALEVLREGRYRQIQSAVPTLLAAGIPGSTLRSRKEGADGRSGHRHSNATATRGVR